MRSPSYRREKETTAHRKQSRPKATPRLDRGRKALLEDGFQTAASRFQFRRQIPIGPYIVDFACHKAGLIIEIDGGQHRSDNPTERARQNFLEQQGYRVLRFWNTDVLSNPEGIHETLQSALFEE